MVGRDFDIGLLSHTTAAHQLMDQDIGVGVGHVAIFSLSAIALDHYTGSDSLQGSDTMNVPYARRATSEMLVWVYNP